MSINEFLKPAEGDKYHGSGGGRGHGRGEGRGDRRGNFAGGGSYNARNVSAPHIEDPGQFPTLGGKWYACAAGHASSPLLNAEQFKAGATSGELPEFQKFSGWWIRRDI